MQPRPVPFTADQRRDSRRSMEVPVTMTVENAALEGTTDNVSGVGVMFFAEEALRVSVTFTEPDGTERTHHGRLVRTQKMTETTTGFAVEFDPK